MNISRYKSGIFVEGPWKTHIFDKGFQCRDLNPAPSQYEASMLPTGRYELLGVFIVILTWQRRG